MKLLLAIFVICSSLAARTLAQNDSLHEADLVVRDGDSARSTRVLLSTANGSLSIKAKKAKKEVDIVIPLSDIKQADYSYSRRLQIWEGLANVGALSLICGCVSIAQVALFMPYAFSKKKQHWLVLETDKASLVLKLGQHDYRDLILELHKKGVNVSDSGKR